MARKNQMQGQQVVGTSDCGEKTTSLWRPRAPCLLDHTVGEMLLGGSAALRSTRRDVYTVSASPATARPLRPRCAVGWPPGSLQAECFSSGAGPASVTATACPCPSHSDSQADECVHLHFAGVAGLQCLCSFPEVFDGPRLWSDGTLAGVKNQMSTRDAEILRTGSMAGVETVENEENEAWQCLAGRSM